MLELNILEKGLLVDIVRVLGYLNLKMFEVVCFNNLFDGCEKEIMRKDRVIFDVEILCNEWRSKISNGVWEFYIEGLEEGEEEDDWV